MLDAAIFPAHPSKGGVARIAPSWRRGCGAQPLTPPRLAGQVETAPARPAGPDEVPGWIPAPSLSHRGLQASGLRPFKNDRSLINAWSEESQPGSRESWWGLEPRRSDSRSGREQHPSKAAFSIRPRGSERVAPARLQRGCSVSSGWTAPRHARSARAA